MKIKLNNSIIFKIITLAIIFAITIAPIGSTQVLDKEINSSRLLDNTSYTHEFKASSKIEITSNNTSQPVDQTYVEWLFSKNWWSRRVGVIYRLENNINVPYILLLYYYGTYFVPFRVDGTAIGKSFYLASIQIHKPIVKDPYTLITIHFDEYHRHMDILRSDTWSRSYYEFVSTPHIVIEKDPNTYYIVTLTTDSKAHIYELSNGNVQKLFSVSVVNVSSTNNMWILPGCYYNNTLYFAYHQASKDANIYIAKLNLSTQQVETFQYNTSNSKNSLYATIAFMYNDVSYADMKYPWYAGYSPYSGILYIFNLESGQWSEYNLTELYGLSGDAKLALINTSDGIKVMLVGLNNTVSPPHPVIMLIDPDNGTIYESRDLIGYNTDRVQIELAPYAGINALYLAVHNNVVVLDPTNLTIIGSWPTNISYPMGIDYSENNGLGILIVFGYKSDGSSKLTEVYAVGGLAKLTRLSMNVPEKAYAGVPIQVNVSLRDYKGQPLDNKTVFIEELSTNGWMPIAAGLTDSNGSASFSILFYESGPHMLRAHYVGGDGYTASYTSIFQVTVIQRVVLSVELSASQTVEGIPVSAIVSAVSLSGEPISGIWVTVYTNMSGVPIALGTGLTNYAGKAIIPISLPSGTYMIYSQTASPYTEVVLSQSAELTVYDPSEPPPQGPYPSPVGRVLSFAPPMAEIGKNTTVVFAFYYGEQLVKPQSYEVRITPAESFLVDEIQPGIYVVSFTPSQTGIYTVIFEATYNYATYVGAAPFYVYNVEEQVSEWGRSIASILDNLESLNESIEIITNVTSQLESLNLTSLNTMIASVNENVTTLLVLVGNIRDNTTRLVEITENATLIAERNGQLILQVNESLRNMINTSTLRLLEANNQTILTITSNGEILAVIQENLTELMSKIVELNASIVSSINMGKEEVVAIINSSVGALALDINTLSQLLQATNAQVAKIYENTVIINTSLGVITANIRVLGDLLQHIGYNITDIQRQGSDIMNTLITLDSKIGELNITVQNALLELGVIQGIIQSINSTGNDILVRISTTEGNITVRLNQLNGKLLKVDEGIAVLNTSIGTLVADVDDLGISAMRLLNLTNETLDRLSELKNILNLIEQKLNNMQIELQDKPTQEQLQEVQLEAEDAKKLGIAGTGLATFSIVSVGLLLRKLKS